MKIEIYKEKERERENKEKIAREYG